MSIHDIGLAAHGNPMPTTVEPMPMSRNLDAGQ